jgi:hypothetical protein
VIISLRRLVFLQEVGFQHGKSLCGEWSESKRLPEILREQMSRSHIYAKQNAEKVKALILYSFLGPVMFNYKKTGIIGNSGGNFLGVKQQCTKICLFPSKLMLMCSFYSHLILIKVDRHSLTSLRRSLVLTPL